MDVQLLPNVVVVHQASGSSLLTQVGKQMAVLNSYMIPPELEPVDVINQGQFFVCRHTSNGQYEIYDSLIRAERLHQCHCYCRDVSNGAHFYFVKGRVLYEGYGNKQRLINKLLTLQFQPREISCTQHELIILYQGSIQYLDRRTLGVEKNILHVPDHIRSLSFLCNQFVVANETLELYEVVVRKTEAELNRAEINFVYANGQVLFNGRTGAAYQLSDGRITIIQRAAQEDDGLASTARGTSSATRMLSGTSRQLFGHSVRLQTVNTALLEADSWASVSFSPSVCLDLTHFGQHGALCYCLDAEGDGYVLHLCDPRARRFAKCAFPELSVKEEKIVNLVFAQQYLYVLTAKKTLQYYIPLLFPSDMVGQGSTILAMACLNQKLLFYQETPQEPMILVAFEAGTAQEFCVLEPERAIQQLVTRRANFAQVHSKSLLMGTVSQKTPRNAIYFLFGLNEGARPTNTEQLALEPRQDVVGTMLVAARPDLSALRAAEHPGPEASTPNDIPPLDLTAADAVDRDVHGRVFGAHSTVDVLDGGSYRLDALAPEDEPWPSMRPSLRHQRQRSEYFQTKDRLSTEGGLRRLSSFARGGGSGDSPRGSQHRISIRRASTGVQETGETPSALPEELRLRDMDERLRKQLSSIELVPSSRGTQFKENISHLGEETPPTARSEKPSARARANDSAEVIEALETAQKAKADRESLIEATGIRNLKRILVLSEAFLTH